MSQHCENCSREVSRRQEHEKEVKALREQVEQLETQLQGARRILELRRTEDGMPA